MFYLTAGFRSRRTRTNDYNFISERALDARGTYLRVDGISLAALREMYRPD